MRLDWAGLQRAQEIQQADPKVAYYCRLYSVEQVLDLGLPVIFGGVNVGLQPCHSLTSGTQALKFPQRSKELNALVVATLGQLEKDKAKLTLEPEEDKLHCEAFALRIFANADKVDRAGKATENTSKAYYAASIFIEVGWVRSHAQRVVH